MIPSKFIDIHVHCTPDTFARRYDIFTLGNELKNHNGHAIIKSHLISTTPIAQMARKMGYPISGSITLNQYTGGIKRSVVEAAYASNGNDNSPMMIWFPTITEPNPNSRTKQKKFHKVLEDCPQSFERVSNNGRLKQETLEIIRFASYYNIPMATGHASKEEVYMLIEETEKHNCKLMITHPFYKCTLFSVPELVDIILSSNNVYIELAILMQKIGYDNFSDIINLLQKVETRKICLSSDFGQQGNSSIIQGYQSYITQLMEEASRTNFVLENNMLEDLCYNNAKRFLGQLNE